MSISIDKGWVNDAEGNRVPIWAGEFHYFRNKREHWPKILRNMKDANLTVVTSFVQPNWHEYEPGKFDFQGKTAPERDLPHLLELAKEIGLYVHLRLGPACCEWRESGGTSFGTNWRDISDAMWAVVGKYQADKGGSLLLYQIHNEWFHPLLTYYVMKPVVDDFDGFRAQSVPHWLELCGPNPHYLSAGYEFSMDWFPEYLGSLYADVSELNNAWGTSYASFEAVKEELLENGVDTLHKYIVFCQDEFGKARYPQSSPRRVVDMLNWPIYYTAAPLAADVDHTRKDTSLPIFHNWSMGDERRWSKMAHLDLAGYDMYAPMSADIWNWSKNTYDMQSSTFPFSNEFMCGTIERYEWGGQGYWTDNFARMEILSYIMGGMKGVNLYMFVERDNWLQCPLDERGGKRSSYEVISGIYGALRRNKWHELDMVRDLGVFKNTAYHLYADGSDDGIFDPGYPDDYLWDGLYGGHAAKQQFVATFRALHDASIDFEVFKDTRNGETIRDFICILVYSLWFMDRRAANDLLEFVENGGALVLFPCVPTHGEDGKELDVFTDKLGLQPFGDTQSSEDHIPPQELDIDAVLAATSGDFRTADGRLWTQARTFGKGKALALNSALADDPEALEKVVTQWGGCRKYVETKRSLTDGGMAMKGDEYAVAAVVNGREDGRVSEVAVDVSKLKPSDTYAVTDELTDSLIGDFEAVDGVVRVPVDLGPRDGMMLKVTAGKSEKSPSKEVEFETTELVQWKARSEDEIAYHDIYLGPEIDESWAAVPSTEWTLSALASGKVLGVQGWFYLKQNVKLPDADGEVYVQVKPNGFHNLGVVYVNGTECGRFMIERPGAASSFDVTDLVRRGEENTIAIRLYRQSLDCHDRGSSGFDVLRFECGSAIVDVDELRLKQEIRDFGEKAGWPDADVSDGEWRAVQVPLDVTMNRGGDALWLRTDVEAGACESAYLHIEGNNCVAAVFVNGEYAVKSPMLPCKLPVGEFLKPGMNKIAVRVTPDNFDNYLVPRDKRYESYIQNGLLPLDVKIEKVELRVAK